MGSTKKKAKPDSREVQDAALKTTRKAWVEELSRRGWLRTCSHAQWDEVSLSVRGRPGRSIPDVVMRAGELEGMFSAYSRILERDFVHGGLATWMDPADDPQAIAALVDRVWNLVMRTGPTREPSWTFFDGSAATYVTLPEADQRRWRVALMRYVDLCAELGQSTAPDQNAIGSPEAYKQDDDSPEATLAIALESLPFDMRDVVAAVGPQLPRLVESWRTTTAGAKRADSKLRSKWRQLQAVLRDAWGVTETTRALSSEWARHGTRRDGEFRLQPEW